jgi:hypothetical protein
MKFPVPHMKSKISTKRPKPAKVERTTPLKPTGAFKLIRASLIEYRRGFVRYALIVSVIAVPYYLLTLIPGINKDSASGALAEIALLVMNVALLWAIVQRERTNRIPSISEAYYEGTSSFVRFIVICFLLVLMVIPALLGGFLYLIGLVAADSGGTLYEQIIITITCLLIASLSAWMLIRFAMAPVIAVADGLRPLASLRLARRLTLDRFWRVFARYAALILFIIIIALPITLISAGLALLKLTTVSNFFAELATSIAALPLANIYLVRLYRDLERGPALDIEPETPSSDNVPIVESDASIPPHEV